MAMATGRRNDSAVKVDEPNGEVDKPHKVLLFGRIHDAQSKEERNLYRFLHQRVDFGQSEGNIPVGFLSKLVLEGDPLFLQTRSSPSGPQYKVMWKAEKEPVGAGSDEGWHGDLDELWISVLKQFETKGSFFEESLQMLDSDPFVLFGIDDAITQKALQKLQQQDMYPALLCEGPVPALPEWKSYLGIDAKNDTMDWLVQAFSETELPKPWTCYKGVGSIVCYIHSSTGQVTWRHPFYDYFHQLRNFCAKASREEVLQVRCNRLLWSYETTRIVEDHEQELLVSPEYVKRLASIFGYDVNTQGCVVRTVKAQLKSFANSYRQTQNIDISEIVSCAEILQRDVDKYDEMQRHWKKEAHEDVSFELYQLANGELQCVHCEKTALSFCLECKDYLCLNCYTFLHAKGARLNHSPFRLVPCVMCIDKPAKLHCTFTDKALCHRCYAMKHIKMLPSDGKENQPRRIEYRQQYDRFADDARKRREQLQKKHENSQKQQKPDDKNYDAYDSVLSTAWHPFYDARGVKYYHNFSTGERMRQSPRRSPNVADKGVESSEAVSQGGSMTAIGQGSSNFFQSASTMAVAEHTQQSSTMRNTTMNQSLSASFLQPGGSLMPPATLSTYDSLKTEPAASLVAGSEPVNRECRPPHRVHMPFEVPAS